MTTPWEKYSSGAGPWSKYTALPEQDQSARARAENRLADEYETNPQLARLNEPGAAENVLRGIPIVGGAIDEISASLSAAGHTLTNGVIGSPYDDALEYNRARYRKYDRENPGISFGQKLAGGVLSAPLGAAARGATALGTLGRSVGIGAAYGAGQGFVDGEGGLSKRAENAAETAKAGAALGGVIPVAAGAANIVASATRPVAPWIRARLPGGTATRIADDIIASRIGSSGLTARGLANDLARGQQAARLGPNSAADLPEMLADRSDTLQRLTGSVYRQGGRAGDLVRGALDRRQLGDVNRLARGWDGDAGQAGRIEDSVARALRLRTSPTARQTERQITATQAAEGRRLYAAAFTTDHQPFEIGPAMQSFRNKMADYQGPFRASMERAFDLFRAPSSSFINSGRPTFTTNLRRFDNGKKQLDDMIESARRNGDNNLARELTQFKTDLLDNVHGTDPVTGEAVKNLTYRDARNAWGSAAENREAINLGRSALRAGSEVAAEQYNSLTRGQQELFRVGFLESLHNHLGGVRGGNDATLLFQQGRVQDLLRAIVPNSRGRNDAFGDLSGRLGELINRETRMGQTRQRITGGSPTASRLEDDKQFAADALSRIMIGARGLTNSALEFIGHIIQQATGVRQDVALVMARRLTDTNPQRQAAYLANLQRRMRPQRFQALSRELHRITPAIISATGAQQEAR